MFFGEGYNKVVLLINVISPIILFIGLSNAIGNQYLLAIKRQREYTISVLCGAFINFIMNSILIWKMGALGASIGTVIAELTVTLVQIYFVRKDFDLKKMVKLSRNYIVASIIMFIVCLIVRQVINNNFISVVTQVAVGGLTYGLCLLILKDEFVYEMLNRLKQKVIR